MAQEVAERRIAGPAVDGPLGAGLDAVEARKGVFLDLIDAFPRLVVLVGECSGRHQAQSEQTGQRSHLILLSNSSMNDGPAHMPGHHSLSPRPLMAFEVDQTSAFCASIDRSA